jgi:hypothetical protein
MGLHGLLQGQLCLLTNFIGKKDKVPQIEQRPDYGLDDQELGFDSRQRIELFLSSTASRPAELQPASSLMNTWVSFPGYKAIWDLTTQLDSVTRLRLRGAVSPLAHIYVYMA